MSAEPGLAGGLLRPRPWGSRRSWLVLIAAAAVASGLALELSPNDLWPSGAGWSLLGEFLGAALSPAFDYEAPVPEGTTPLLLKVLDSLRRTMIFAGAGMSLALLIGLPLGVVASTRWWKTPDPNQSRWRRLAGQVGRSTIFGLLRSLIAFMRSVHELLWAVLLLAALGLNSFSAVWAIAIPYGGTLAKVFSEMIDEAPRDTTDVLEGIGANRWQVFLFGSLPRALPDMATYAFYRLECALRSSAVLGFFGFPTLGYFVKIAFVNQHFHEVWTYLWALILVVLLLEALSSAMRQRVVVH